jgi:N-glycosylase/DNA lyase
VQSKLQKTHNAGFLATYFIFLPSLFQERRKRTFSCQTDKPTPCLFERAGDSTIIKRMKSLYEIHTEDIVQIHDDFDLQKIAASGQVFRALQINDAGEFRFIHGDNILFIQKIDNSYVLGNQLTPDNSSASDDTAVALSSSAQSSTFRISCDSKTWQSIWAPYFDLQRSYRDIRKRAAASSDFIDITMDFGRGLRILKQDPWEMLVTFIISQRKSMPAIASAVDALCRRFGQPITEKHASGLSDSKFAEGMARLLNASTAYGAFAFPTPEALAAATQEELRACSLGYRAPYVADAARRVVSGELDLERAAKMDDQALFEYLQTVHGVGKKVANCVCLFGFGRTSLVPVDVWIARAIDAHCDGNDPFAQFGQDAGVIQQYVFYYMTQTRNKAQS